MLRNNSKTKMVQKPKYGRPPSGFGTKAPIQLTGGIMSEEAGFIQSRNKTDKSLVVRKQDQDQNRVMTALEQRKKDKDDAYR